MAYDHVKNDPLSAAVPSSGTTETLVLSQGVGADLLSPGSTYVVKLAGVKDSTSATVTCRLRLGPTATTSDALVASVALTAVSTGTWVDGILTVQTAGPTGTAIGQLYKSVGTASAVSSVSAPIAVNTGASNYVTLTVQSSAGTFTVQNALIKAQ